ncbi:hypothetical protein [Streptomyces sp. bgisy031]|uniref:hypothetical protein n=1 Tax=Streptomyces sp. bgisy031 TaxID=3413772 RepID=UPI003D76485F
MTDVAGRRGPESPWGLGPSACARREGRGARRTLPPATGRADGTLPKLYQVAPDGKGGPQRMSRNRGDQVYAAADTDRRVLRLDGTTGCTNLVKRDRPAGRC